MGKLKRGKTTYPTVFQHRSMDNEQIVMISDELINTDWTYLNDLNVNEAYRSFQSKLSTTIGVDATERTIRIPAELVIHEAWMILSLLRAPKTLATLLVSKREQITHV